MVRVRFAPSPTGPLHIGGVRTALFNYAFARRERGTFILRIDDTDVERSRKEFEEDITSNLRWLGLEWDEGPNGDNSAMPYRQSERLDRYESARDQLLEAGRAYLHEEGTIRLKYPRGKIVINDIICGECTFTVGSLGPEPVLFRSDGRPTYHLASVCDDIDMAVTHVIRGQDHLTNTAKHKVMFEALGATPPQFAHLPLILGDDRSKLSKRHSEGLVSVTDFRAAGYLSQALLNFLMLLGWSHPEAKELLGLEEFIAEFELSRVSRTAAVFEKRKLDFLNGWWLRHLPTDEVAKLTIPYATRWAEEIKNRGGEFWITVVGSLRDGLTTLRESDWLAELVFSDAIELDEATIASNLIEKDLCVSVISRWIEILTANVPADGHDRYSEGEYRQLISILKKQVGLSGQSLFHPVRLAVMSRFSGPELKVLVPLVRHDLLISRARFVTNQIKML